VYVLFGPALVVLLVAIPLRLVFRNRPWARAFLVAWVIALIVAVLAFMDGMRYACCVD
jgi:hypothetical protein